MNININYEKLVGEQADKAEIFAQKIRSYYQKIENLTQKITKIKLASIKQTHNLRKGKFIEIDVNYNEDSYVIRGLDDEFNGENGLIEYIFQTYPNELVLVSEYFVDQFLNVPEKTPRCVLVINTIIQKVLSYSI